MRSQLQTKPIPKPSFTPVPTGLLQRKCTCGNSANLTGKCNECENKRLTLQRRADNQAEPDQVPPIVHEVLRSPGRPLNLKTRTFMESRFRQNASQVQVHSVPAKAQTQLTIDQAGDIYEQEADRVANRVMELPKADASNPSNTLSQFDFSQVRVHTDRKAAESAQAVRALAYTVGHDIAFAQGHYDPETIAGRRLLAHELTHVIQQTSNSWQSDRRPLLQRQGIDDLPPLNPPEGEPTRSGGATAPPIPMPTTVPIPAQQEPGCPRGGTNLGNLAPVPPCNETGEDIDGQVFSFCRDSDIFVDPTTPSNIAQFAQQQPSLSSFRVRAYASIEGPGTAAEADLYNRRLACHRVKRVVRELINAGVREQRIDAVAKGPTERFGTGSPARPLNRVAVIDAVAPTQQPAQLPDRPSAQQVRDAAKARLVQGDYRLGADAYLARWTCGRFRSLADAVARTTVQIEGLDFPSGRVGDEGNIGLQGQNTILLSSTVMDALDPVGCAANRIADLTFHHMARPQLPSFAEQHQGGMHMLFLGGFSACQISSDPLNVHIRQLSVPSSTDPKAGLQPACADLPLPGAIAPQRQPSRPPQHPTFTVTPIQANAGSGSLIPSSSNPLSVGVEPAAPIRLTAEVTSAGDPREIAKYEVGFLQTVMVEDNVTTYVDGRRVRWRFPLPLRDGAPQGHPLAASPWFDRFSKTQAQLGQVTVNLEDAPNFRAFRFFPEPSTTQFAFSSPTPPPGVAGTGRHDFATFRPTGSNRNNVPDRGHRELHFNTWVVARQANPPAPATLNSTEFLQGVRLVLRQEVSWVGHANSLVGTGSFRLTATPAGANDWTSMELRGATPLDFVSPQGVPLFNEFLSFEGAAPIAQAGGLGLTQYHQEVERIAAPHRNTPGLRRRITVRIRIDMSTGRLPLDTPDLQGGTIRILSGDGSTLDPDEANRMAQAIFPEIRKLVAGRLTHNQPATGIIGINITLQPLP